MNKKDPDSYERNANKLGEPQKPKSIKLDVWDTLTDETKYILHKLLKGTGFGQNLITSLNQRHGKMTVKGKDQNGRKMTISIEDK